jgi:hypothetical protein
MLDHEMLLLEDRSQFAKGRVLLNDNAVLHFTIRVVKNRINKCASCYAMIDIKMILPPF